MHGSCHAWHALALVPCAAIAHTCHLGVQPVEPASEAPSPPKPAAAPVDLDAIRLEQLQKAGGSKDSTDEKYHLADAGKVAVLPENVPAEEHCVRACFVLAALMAMVRCDAAMQGCPCQCSADLVQRLPASASALRKNRSCARAAAAALQGKKKLKERPYKEKAIKRLDLKDLVQHAVLPDDEPRPPAAGLSPQPSACEVHGDLLFGAPAAQQQPAPRDPGNRFADLFLHQKAGSDQEEDEDAPDMDLSDFPALPAEPESSGVIEARHLVHNMKGAPSLPTAVAVLMCACDVVLADCPPRWSLAKVVSCICC